MILNGQTVGRLTVNHIDTLPHEIFQELHSLEFETFVDDVKQSDSRRVN